MGIFRGLYSVPLINVSLHLPGLHRLITVAIGSFFKLDSVIPLILFLVFKIVLAILVPLSLPLHFRIILFIPIKNVCWNFNRNLINLVYRFGEN